LTQKADAGEGAARPVGAFSALCITADGLVSDARTAGASSSAHVGGSAEGFVAEVRYVASPNCDERPCGAKVELLVIHAISLPPGQFGGPGIEALFLNRLDASSHPYYAQIADLRVSAHFVVRRDGALLQFVPCSKRAWHAGLSSWRGRSRCNDFSVGIELEGADDIPFEDAQYGTLQALTRALQAAYPISDITGHSDIAPGRKTDPGPLFDWPRYQAAVGTKFPGFPG
jgi:AmpD protein